MYSHSLDGKYSIGDSIIVNTRNNSVEVDGAPVKLRRQVYLSLLLLMENRLHDTYVPYDDFSKTMPEGRASVGDCISNESVRKIISELNSKLKSKVVVPSNGLGYYLKPDVMKTDSQPQTGSAVPDPEDEMTEMVKQLLSFIKDHPDIIEKACALQFQRDPLSKTPTISISNTGNVFSEIFDLHSLEDSSPPHLEEEYKPGDVVLRHWKLTHMLGRGGFGYAYEAIREENGFTQRAAIRIMHFNPPTKEDKTCKTGLPWDAFPMAYSEVTALQAFKGRTNIICYEEFGIVELKDGGRDLIVRMDLLKSISHLVLENSMQQDDVVRLGINICKALETCHSLGFIHGLVSPDNIYITPGGDFKLGVFDLPARDNCPSTVDRIIIPQFAAPEVIRGGTYSSNVDTYSLGIVMYCLLNGRRYPFLSQKQYLPSADAPDFALSRRLAGEQLPQIPHVKPQLQNIVLKACAFRPKNRFQTAAEMRKALEKIR